MSDVNIARTLFSYVIDAQIDGLATTIFTTTSGTPAVSSNKYRLNNAAIRSNFELLFGEVVFPVTIPTAPTAGHGRRLGFRTYGPAGNGSIYFEVSGAVLSAKVITNAGTTFTEVIPWNSAWTNTQTLFRLGWGEKAAVFTIGSGSNQTQVVINVGVTEFINLPAYLVVESTVADNMDLPYIELNNVGRFATLSSAGVISSVTPGTGASNLGKSEDAVFASGDVGVMALAVANEAGSNLSGTDGDYTPIRTNRAGTVYNQDTTAPVAENNTVGEGWLSTAVKYSATSTNKPTYYQNNSFTTQNVKASAGTVVGFSAINTTGSARYVQFHNTATTPAGGATARQKFLVPANSQIVLFTEGFSANGTNYDTGIAVANSSTAATYTAGSAGDLLVEVFYV